MTTDTVAEHKPFQAEVAELLHLMVHSVYSETDIFLRELISNASDALDKLRYEAIAAPELTADGEQPRIRIVPDKKAGTLSVIDKKDHARWFRAIWDDVPGSNRLRGHPAPFPIEVAYRLTSMFSFVGDTVLDPFMGTGSTALGAAQASRASIGYEIEPTYLAIARDRLLEELGPERVQVGPPRPAIARLS